MKTIEKQERNEININIVVVKFKNNKEIKFYCKLNVIVLLI